MARLFLQGEHSPFMMSFVFFTDRDRAIVIDGGQPADMPDLKTLLGRREIAAWILTHPHFDHISGFVDEAEKGTLPRLPDRIYCDFPSLAFVRACEPEITPCSAADFQRILPRIQHRVTRPLPGDTVTIDDLCIRFLYAGGEAFRKPKPNLAVNESSMAFRVTGAGLRSVLFLGDMGPCAGRTLLRLYGPALKSDIVQMAHHGHAGVTEEVYRCIAPEACMWCAPNWLWEEADEEFEPELWGTRHTRKWMEALGVKEHYVSKDGHQEIPLKRKNR